MTNCGAPGCTNRSEHDKNLSFHRIPKKEEMRKRWLQKLQRKIIPKTLFVCSDHFESSCFERDLRSELMGEKPKKILKEDAVPTIFQHQTSSRKR